MKDFIVEEKEYNAENIAFFGNKFLIGNGYFGVRGTMEEYSKENMPAVNLAGIYDKVGDRWRESVNAPNPLYTIVKVNGKVFSLPDIEPVFHMQSLNIKEAVHMRKTVWKTENGKITVFCERFASMAQQHIIGMRYTVSADFDAEVEILTGIDGDVWDINGPHFSRIETLHDDRLEKVVALTQEKEITVTCEQCVRPNFECDFYVKVDKYSIFKVLKFNVKSGLEYEFEKLSSVKTSCDDFELNKNIYDMSYTCEKAEHISAWQKIWDMSYIEIEGDEYAEYALNYSIYHLNCIAPRNLKNKSIAARGLSGQVYKGAVFWDTEMFMIDYYIYTEPDIARTLIEYRIDTLGGALKKASEYNLDGAYYAWESQEGGYEGCSDYNVVDVFTKRPMRTHFRDKQYHISAAVVYAVVKYLRVTNDFEILKNGALEMIIECAKMYRSLLTKRADSDFYEICDVVGPDEYHERVNNNVYTNKMAQFTFKTAVDLIENADHDLHVALSKKYDLKHLCDIFKDSYKNIKIIQPGPDNGIIEQFDGYFKLEDCSVSAVRSRLLDPKEYWGGAYGVASQTQVIKQADVIAMLSIFKDEYLNHIIHKNWNYYEPRTEHGSSLSACMYSLAACYIGDPDAAEPFFIKSASVDLNPGGKEWAGLVYIGGTHPASEGGAWIVAVNGFAGIDVRNGEITCCPKLPERWKAMHFKLKYKGTVYKIDIKNNIGEISEI